MESERDPLKRTKLSVLLSGEIAKEKEERETPAAGGLFFPVPSFLSLTLQTFLSLVKIRA